MTTVLCVKWDIESYTLTHLFFVTVYHLEYEVGESYHRS